MAIPDITGLTEEELVTLLQRANAELLAKQDNERAVRETLLDPATVQTQIDNLLTQKDSVQAVIDTPNSDIKANPQQHIMALARAQKRTINNLIRLLKTNAGVLDNADVGDDEPGSAGGTPPTSA